MKYEKLPLWRGHNTQYYYLMKMTSVSQIERKAFVARKIRMIDYGNLGLIFTWYDCSVGLHILHCQLEYLLVLVNRAERRLGGQGGDSGEVSPRWGHGHDSSLVTGCHDALQQRLGTNNWTLISARTELALWDSPPSRDAQNKKHNGPIYRYREITSSP